MKQHVLNKTMLLDSLFIKKRSLKRCCFDDIIHLLLPQDALQCLVSLSSLNTQNLDTTHTHALRPNEKIEGISPASSLKMDAQPPYPFNVIGRENEKEMKNQRKKRDERD
jgi:hypothetical protein